MTGKMTLDEAVAEATRRGTERGREAGRIGRGDAPSWLSGEWAGESIPELLGDLLEAGGCDADDYADNAEIICDAYENAADEAYAVTREGENLAQTAVRVAGTLLSLCRESRTVDSDTVRWLALELREAAKFHPDGE